MAWATYQLLDEPKRKGTGRAILTSAMAINPYNFLVTDTAQASAATPQEQIEFWRTFQTLLTAAGDKVGCKPDGLYSITVKKKVFASIAKLPVPTNKSAARKVYAFLQTEKCDAPAAMVAYQLAVKGLPALLAGTRTEYKQHLIDTRATASTANDTACKMMADTLKAVYSAIKGKKQRTQWAMSLWKQAEGREKYFGRGYRVSTDPAVAFLARPAGKRLPKETQLMQSLLDRLTAELKKSVTAQRDIKNCRTLAAKINAAAKHTKDPDQKRKWTQVMSKIITGKEKFNSQPAKKKPKLIRDPCAEAIKSLLASV